VALETRWTFPVARRPCFWRRPDGMTRIYKYRRNKTAAFENKPHTFQCQTENEQKLNL